MKAYCCYFFFFFFFRHRWLHHTCDETPIEKPPVKRKWIADHEENKTGTKDIYVPYSTTKPKIESWTPPN